MGMESQPSDSSVHRTFASLFSGFILKVVDRPDWMASLDDHANHDICENLAISARSRRRKQSIDEMQTNR
jgi:hypothetical protein